MVETYINNKSNCIMTFFAPQYRIPELKNIHIQGADSFFVPESIFHLNNLDTFILNFHKICKNSFYQDDYVFYVYFVLNNYKIQSLSHLLNGIIFYPVHDIEELHKNPKVYQREKNTITFIKTNIEKIKTILQL